MSFREFLKESALDYENLIYDSGAPEWLIKEYNNSNKKLVISLDINDKENYAFITKKSGKNILYRVSTKKEETISDQRVESMIKLHGLGIHYIK